MMEEGEVLAAQKRAKRFDQLFELISEGYSEYITLSEHRLQQQQEPGPKTGGSISDDHHLPLGNVAAVGQNEMDDDYDDRQNQQQQQKQHWEVREVELLMENHRLHKLHAQRLAKLGRDYTKWHMKLDKEANRLFPWANPLSSTTANSSALLHHHRPPSFSRFAPPLLFCRCPSPQRRRNNNKEEANRRRLYRPPSCQSLPPLNPEEPQKRQEEQQQQKEEEEEETKKIGRQKSHSVLDLTSAREDDDDAAGCTTEESARTVRVGMVTIEAEVCGMLGRLQFQVQGIVGFARLCTGDIFEVSIKHGHQRWRTRGKTQADKSQRWDQQPPTVTLNILWDVPVQVKVLEVGFLRSRCLNERQFDPAKFASAQPQLVTMNLNTVGSIKLRLIATWLPLLSSKPPPAFLPAHHQIGGGGTPSHNGIQQSPDYMANACAKLRQHQSQMAAHPGQGGQWHSKGGGLPPKVPPKRMQSLNGGSPPTQGQSPPPSMAPASEVDGGLTTASSPVKVCLRDKKRQREQRQQMGMSVAASMGSGIGGREASRTDKERWRCSSTTLLDELYKDLSKSIPTIDDLSALHPKSGSIGGGSLGPSAGAHRQSVPSAAADLPPCSSSVSEGRSKSGGGGGSATRRIFSFVKRGAERGAEERRQKEEWRKSISLCQIAPQPSLEETKKGKNVLGAMEEPEEFISEEKRGKGQQNDGGEGEGNEQKNGNYANGGRREGSGGVASARPFKLSHLKKGRNAGPEVDGPSPMSLPNGCSAPSTISSSRTSPSFDSASCKFKELEGARRTVERLLAKIEALRALLTSLRPTEYTELVGFEAAMLNWEACLKLNRSGILCQIDAIADIQNGDGSAGARNRVVGDGGLRQRLANNRNSVLFLHNHHQQHPAQQQHSPSTASDETDESGGGGGMASGGGGTRAMAYHRGVPGGGGELAHGDQISENDSGIDSLRQYHSPYNSSSGGGTSASGSPAKRRSAQQQQNGGGGTGGSSKLSKDRRKSIGAMLDQQQQHLMPNEVAEEEGDGGGRHQAGISATGTPQMDQCLAIHLDRAQRALQAIFDVQASPFEYTLTNMLCQMEGIETIALDSMLGLVQDLLAQCEPNPQNVLLQLGLQFHLQQCWLSACPSADAFLLAPLDRLRAQLRPLCEPIVRSRYPKLVEKVLDSVGAALLVGGGADANAGGDSPSTVPQISLFQFVALFRAKQFPAFIENLSHEAWISANLQSGQAGPIRDVMDRLRNVPVVPPLESLRHIGLALATQQSAGAAPVTAPIEKYLRKVAPALAMDLAACFLCLLEHEAEESRAGACRALAILAQPNSLRCLEFLSRSDSSARVRAEAKNAAAQIHRVARTAIQQRKQREMTKI